MHSSPANLDVTVERFNSHKNGLWAVIERKKKNELKKQKQLSILISGAGRGIWSPSPETLSDQCRGSRCGIAR